MLGVRLSRSQSARQSLRRRRDEEDERFDWQFQFVGLYIDTDRVSLLTDRC